MNQPEVPPSPPTSPPYNTQTHDPYFIEVFFRLVFNYAFHPIKRQHRTCFMQKAQSSQISLPSPQKNALPFQSKKIASKYGKVFRQSENKICLNERKVMGHTRLLNIIIRFLFLFFIQVVRIFYLPFAVDLDDALLHDTQRYLLYFQNTFKTQKQLKLPYKWH